MKRVLLFLVFLPFLAMAHVGNPPADQNAVPDNNQLLFPNYTFQDCSAAQLAGRAQGYLMDNLPLLKAANVSLKFNSSVESPIGYHISFSQQFAGKEIFGTQVKINISRNFRVLSVLSNIVPTGNMDATASFPDPSNAASLVGPYPLIKAKLVWFWANSKAIPAIYIDYGTGNGQLHNLTILDAGNNVLYQKDMRMSFKAKKDSLVKAYVFVPDPLTSARVNYGFPYVDDNDSGIPALNAQRFPEYMTVNYDSSGFSLKDSFLTLDDGLSRPFLPNLKTKDNVLDFSRGNTNFEDVNTYFNIHEYQRHIKSIGFKLLGNQPLSVDPHANDGEDNSFFNVNPDSSTEILFGTGGIYDAQDADVIWHEYTHFISYCANLNSGSSMGDERLAVEEGTCDYIAASYSKFLSDYNWEKVYNWDGNTDSWKGRTCASSKVYPNDFSPGNRYANCVIWSTAMMENWDVIGRDITDKLMLTSLYNFGDYMQMQQGAVIVLQMDSILYGGEHVKTLASRFHWRGLLPDQYIALADIKEEPKPAAYQVLTQYFSSNSKVLIDFDNYQYGNISLYDMQGREISQMPLSGEKQATFQAPAVSSGVYILRINTGDIQQSVKLIK